MIDLLVRNSSIVLQHVVVLQILRDGDLFRDAEDLGELRVGDVVQFGAVVFGDYELQGVSGVARKLEEKGCVGRGDVPSVLC